MTQMKKTVNGVDCYRMYIGGQWVNSSSSEKIEVLNPANEEVIAIVPDASVEDGRRASKRLATPNRRGRHFPRSSVANTSCVSPPSCGKTANGWPGSYYWNKVKRTHWHWLKSMRRSTTSTFRLRAPGE